MVFVSCLLVATGIVVVIFSLAHFVEICIPLMLNIEVESAR